MESGIRVQKLHANNQRTVVSLSFRNSYAAGVHSIGIGTRVVSVVHAVGTHLPSPLMSTVGGEREEVVS